MYLGTLVEILPYVVVGYELIQAVLINDISANCCSISCIINVVPLAGDLGVINIVPSIVNSRWFTTSPVEVSLSVTLKRFPLSYEAIVSEDIVFIVKCSNFLYKGI